MPQKAQPRLILNFDSKPTKRISFVMVTRNRAKFIAKTLKSHQDLIKKNDEFIVIDGGSTDGSLKVFQKYSNVINVFVSEKDISESHAFNKGILLSRGKYLKILTDDDIFFSEAIEEAYKLMEKNPEIDVLLCGGTKYRGKRVTYAYAPPNANYGKSVSDVFKYGGCGLGLLIRKKAFALTGLFTPKSLSMDNDYLAKAIYSGANVKFCRINMFDHFLEDHSAAVNRWDKLIQDGQRIKKIYGIQDSIFLKFRFKVAEIIFPKLPSFIQSIYKNYRKKQKSKTKLKPIWDGGFS